MDTILTNLFSFFNTNFVTGLIVSILVIVIKQVRPAIASLWTELIGYIQTKASSSKYAEVYQVAVNVWYQVEEDFRVGSAITDLFESKITYFDNLLLKKFPSLTADELETLRQAISGKENAAKTATTTVVVDENKDTTEVITDDTTPSEDVTPAEVTPADDASNQEAVVQATLNKIAALIVASDK